jgi:hypothetical protein
MDSPRPQARCDRFIELFFFFGFAFFARHTGHGAVAASASRSSAWAASPTARPRPPSASPPGLAGDTSPGGEMM